MKSRKILALNIQVVILMLATLFLSTALARGGDDPPKIGTKPKTESEFITAALVKLGCKGFLGRADDFLCQGREAMFTCKAFKEDGKVKECRPDLSGPKKILPSRTNEEIARDSLVKLGCTLFLGRADDFLCHTGEERLACDTFKADGLVKECRGPGKPAASNSEAKNSESSSGSSETASPKLVFTGKESYTAGGKNYTRFKLSITNPNIFTGAMFSPAPNLPPCGNNKNSSRTWVTIFDRATGQRIYGYCALASPHDLANLSFAVAEDQTAPGYVYVVLTDRATNTNYKSNSVSTSSH
jgi:hypothetical protein